MDTIVPPQTTELLNVLSQYFNIIGNDVTYINNANDNDNDNNDNNDNNDVPRPTTPDQPTDKTMPGAPKKMK